MYICIYVCIHVHLHIDSFIYICIYMYIYIYICTYILTYVYAYFDMYNYMDTEVHLSLLCIINLKICIFAYNTSLHDMSTIRLST
jgi:hypothetical protein